MYLSKSSERPSPPPKALIQRLIKGSIDSSSTSTPYMIEPSLK